ncbi:unannotated protein [freshwater metagenome]|uniref:Unannotated protein n=1 Tax=freshwater metagenome TaxID=449393 RepID=A0A6J6H3A8_9ZZZZ|nr:aldose 1-epimerase [Actinomycetota bacterium]
MAAVDGQTDGTAAIAIVDGEAALTLRAGPTEFTVFPELGLLGASLRHKERDYLDFHGGPDAARAGHTTGLPLLSPWANRLGSDSFRVAGKKVDLGDSPTVHRDANGLPIHGLMVGRGAWEFLSLRGQAGSASAVARFDAADDQRIMEVFPFKHTMTVAFTVSPGRLTVATTLTATGKRAVPVSFGWHPYFRLPETDRDKIRIGIPARRRLVLDERNLPTGEEVAEPAEILKLAGRTYDDGYRLGRDRQLLLFGGRRRLTIVLDRGYPFAQVYAPEGEQYVALEPMTASTNALVSGGTDMVEPGKSYTARFAISLT